MTQPPNDPTGDQPGVPPQGAVPPQPGQGFPPPVPPQGYGQPGFGQYPPAPQAHFNLGDAISWSWNKFTKNAAALIVPIIVYAIALVAASALAYLLISQFGVGDVIEESDGSTTVDLTTAGSVATVIFSFVGALILYICLVAYTSGLLDIADGKPVSIGSFFAPRNAGPSMLTALLLAIVASLISAIPYVGYIGSIVVGLVTMYILPTVVDRGLGVGEAFKQGFAVFQKDVGNSILVYIVTVVILAIGGALCGVGLLVAAPVASLVLINAYRSISGGAVAPKTP
ncbi:hypothetical protein LB823_10575 [Tsukamurella sp. M9C]|uniref:hypothetical protein n=1 Tax=unclassified Tsukamurella TaxID=2633480 RepID=UPI001CCED1F7|nr:hypothetical protein [Tsukamurella sp. M9C]MCA0156645.1 hypothetical protein [Tsukamurella sp. M9C]